VGLYVPAVQQHFDLLVPGDLEIGSLAELLANGVAELCEGCYTPMERAMLTLQFPETLLHPSKTLASYGIEDGAQLVLF